MAASTFSEQIFENISSKEQIADDGDDKQGAEASTLSEQILENISSEEIADDGNNIQGAETSTLSEQILENISSKEQIADDGDDKHGAEASILSEQILENISSKEIADDDNNIQGAESNVVRIVNLDQSFTVETLKEFIIMKCQPNGAVQNVYIKRNEQLKIFYGYIVFENCFDAKKMTEVLNDYTHNSNKLEVQLIGPNMKCHIYPDQEKIYQPELHMWRIKRLGSIQKRKHEDTDTRKPFRKPFWDKKWSNQKRNYEDRDSRKLYRRPFWDEKGLNQKRKHEHINTTRSFNRPFWDEKRARRTDNTKYTLTDTGGTTHSRRASNQIGESSSASNNTRNDTPMQID